MQLMSINGAARDLGYKSRSQLYKLIDDGCLDDHLLINMPSGQQLLDVDGLRGEAAGSMSMEDRQRVLNAPYTKGQVVVEWIFSR